MTFTNSSLVTTRAPAHTANFSAGRGGNKITRITPHHMAGVLTAAQCGAIFARQSANASANYGVGHDGSVGLYVDEADRSWASSSRDNDNRAVTIEVSNSGGAPDWRVGDVALEKAIDLIEDICRRNEIERLVVGENLTWHSMFTATTCPGPHLRSRFDYIADTVNARLGAAIESGGEFKDNHPAAEGGTPPQEGNKSEEGKEMQRFNDVQGHWAEQIINDLQDFGIVNGDGNGNFHPNDTATRAEVASMIRNVVRYITGK